RRNRVENGRTFAQTCAMTELRVLAAVLTVLVFGGCKKPAAPAPAPVSTSQFPTQAQPKLQTMKLWLGSEEMLAELALTSTQQMTGMMFRTNLAEDAGMLFPLPYTQRASFWMTNCPLALSAAYIDPEGVIQEIHDLQPHNSNPVIAATNNIR